MGSKIEMIEIYLPEKILTNDDLHKEFPDWNSDMIEQKVGIIKRHVSSENETALDLSFNAAEKLLLNFDRDLIDFVLLCTQCPDYILPTSACILQAKLKLRNNIGAFDFNLGCSGFIYGLAIAKSLISSRIAKNILVITAETYTKLIHPKDKANLAIFGDAAAATLVSYNDKEHVFEFDLGTDGSGWNNLVVHNGAFRNKYNPNAELLEAEFGNFYTKNNLYMNGTEIFNFTIANVPICFNNILNKNKITLDSIDYVIFHQANKYMINYLRKKIQIPEAKFYNNLLETGNTVSASIPIALHDAIKKGDIKKGKKVLLLGFGVGYSWGGTILEI